LAITPSAEILAKVDDHVQRLRHLLRDRQISWEKPEKRHVTLQFLGDVEQDQIGSIAEAIEAGTHRLRPFEMTARGIGVFPNARRPRVLWVGMASETADLLALHQVLHDVAQPFVLRQLDARFFPHLTIARIRGDQHAVSRSLKDELNVARPEFGRWDTSQLELWSSKLATTGSTYELIRAFPLGRWLDPIAGRELPGL
jgi:2'-5' RNA ligase